MTYRPWTEELRRIGRVQYEADDYSWREGLIDQPSDVNGSLVYVRDEETGEAEWLDYRRVKR